MWSTALWISQVVLLSTLCSADANESRQLGSKNILPSAFTPPQVFQHVNLVRTIQLSKSYPKETINVVVENIDKQPQQEYYIPFEQSLLGRIGGLEIKDKKSEEVYSDVEVVEYDQASATEFYRVRFPTPLTAGDKLTISISWFVLSALEPLPKEIEQNDKQYVQHVFSAYMPSAYKTLKQKTNLKLASADITDYTLVGVNAEGNSDPQKSGTTLTYGPYGEVEAGAQQLVSVRYEFTKPLVHATLLERDVEVSHWGGNMAIEERYWLTNRAATLKNHFSRVAWQQALQRNPETTALKGFAIPLAVGSLDPYYTDDIGNVSTSRFRTSLREAMLEIKPRYPLFGGWNYKFRIGWDASLATFLRKVKGGDGYVLKVPFLEGPRLAEGIEYERVVLSFVLPEGASNVKFDSAVQVVSTELTTKRTFMDTTGRTVLRVTAMNVVDEMRNKDITVTYDYPLSAGFRKPIVIIVSLLSTFAAAWLFANVDVKIGSGSLTSNLKT